MGKPLRGSLARFRRLDVRPLKALESCGFQSQAFDRNARLGRNVEVMWLLGRLIPDHKTIADLRKDTGGAIRKVCAQFVALSRELGLLTPRVADSTVHD